MPDLTSPEEKKVPTQKPIRGHRLIEREEKFVPSEPIEPGGATEIADEPVEDRICFVCDKEFEDGATTIFVKNEDAYAHVDCLEPDKPEVPPAAAEETPEALLVIESETPKDDYWLLVERLPQWETTQRVDPQAESEYLAEISPVTMHYREQIRKEAAAQNHKGRNHYRCRMYRRGHGMVKGGLWKCTLTIVPPAAADSSPTSAAAPGFKPLSFREQMEELAATNKSVREALGIPTRPQLAESNPPPPPKDPLEQLQSSISMVTSMMTLAKTLQSDNGGNGSGSTAPGDKTTGGMVLDYVRELGVGEMIRDLGKGVAPIITRMAIEKMAGNNQPPQNQQPQIHGGGQPQQPEIRGANSGQAGSAAVDDPSTNAVSVGTLTSPAPGSRLPPPDSLPPQAIEMLLKPIVQDMQMQVRDRGDDDDYDATSACQACQLAQAMYPAEAESIIKKIIPMSGVQLVIWLSQQAPELAYLAGSPDAIEYAAYCEDWRDGLIELLKQGAAESQDSGLRNQESEQSTKIEDQRSASDVSRVTSERDTVADLPILDLTDSAAGVIPTRRDEADSLVVIASPTLEAAPAAEKQETDGRKQESGTDQSSKIEDQSSSSDVSRETSARAGRNPRVSKGAKKAK